jgi:hypothetical protein
MLIRICLSLSLLGTGIGNAQITTWKLGGNSFDWVGNDTTRVMIDFTTAGSIQPQYVEAGQNIIQLAEDWFFRRAPRELNFARGESPRIWKWNNGTGANTENGTFLVDGDSTTYNVPKAEEIEQQFFTIDLAVPIPARQFGFFTPSQGFRSNGKLLREDAVPAYQVSIQEEDSPLLDQKADCATVASSSASILSGACAVLSLEKIVGEVTENFESDIRIDFPQQYVRFIRYARKLSLLDAEDLNRCGQVVEGQKKDNAQATRKGCAGQGNLATALKGTVADFELFGEGAPKKAIYKSKIIDLGTEQNFGRLFFAATPMRVVDGVAVPAPTANAWVEVAMRTGRDDDPNLYHEFTILGSEKVVSRDHYENVLIDRFVRRCTLCDPEPRAPKPGLRASITYDSDNWTFWSTAINESGNPLELRNGRYIQFLITLQSRTFSDFVRLDSLWIEQAPLLAQQVVGEVARLDEKQPARGFTQVPLGEMTDFVYDIGARFDSETGFDAVRVHTGARTLFKSLEIGTPIDSETPPESVPFVPITPEQVFEEADGLLIHLSESITGQRNNPIRLVFAAEVFDLATTFQGEVLDRSRAGLPQLLVDGDVTRELSTNSLRVLGASGAAPDLLQDFSLSASSFTPNGDGINDELQIRYGLFHLPEAVPVVLEVYALDGRKLAAIDNGIQRSGAQAVRWDGRDQSGQILAPGIYLLSVAVASESTGSKKIRPVGIFY